MKTFQGNIFTRNTFTDLVHVSEPCTTVIKIFKAKTLKHLVEEQTYQRGFGQQTDTRLQVHVLIQVI